MIVTQNKTLTTLAQERDGLRVTFSNTIGAYWAVDAPEDVGELLRCAMRTGELLEVSYDDQTNRIVDAVKA